MSEVPLTPLQVFPRAMPVYEDVFLDLAERDGPSIIRIRRYIGIAERDGPSVRIRRYIGIAERDRRVRIRRYAPPVEELGHGTRGSSPAAKSAIEALETFEVCVSEEEEEERVCAVCKDAMVMGEIGKKLPCGHCYHEKCILPWLVRRNSCPLCRFQLQTDDV